MEPLVESIIGDPGQKVRVRYRFAPIVTLTDIHAVNNPRNPLELERRYAAD
jgi:hypothetical protein